MTWVSNKCGGARFRTLPDFRVEIEGRGPEAYTEKDPEYRYLKQTWKNWSGLIRKHARKTGMPPSHLLAVATKETGLWSGDPQKQASIGSPAGAQGIMQVMPCDVFKWGKYKDLVCGRDRSDPDVSLNQGSVLLKAHLDNYGGLPAAASAYNAGGLKCYSGQHERNVFNWHHEHNYAHKVVKYNNAAVAMGVNSGFPWAWVVGGLALAGAGIYVSDRFMRGKRGVHLLLP